MNNLDVVVPVDAVMDEPSSNQPVKNTPNKNINKNSKILKKVIPLPIAEEMLDKEFPTVPASHLDLANEKGAVDHSRLSLTRMTNKFGQLQRENDLLQKKLLHSASVGSFNNYHLDVSESSEGTDNRHRDMQMFRCHANPSMGHLRSKSERFAVRPKELTLSDTSDNFTKHTATTAATSAHCFSEVDVSEKSEDSMFTKTQRRCRTQRGYETPE
eukprot:g10417.t1 g10417   contig4:1840128-1841130(-)